MIQSYAKNGLIHALGLLAVLCMLQCAEEAVPGTDLASRPATQSALLTVVYGESGAPGMAAQPVVIDGFFARHGGFNFEDVL